MDPTTPRAPARCARSALEVVAPVTPFIDAHRNRIAWCATVTTSSSPAIDAANRLRAPVRTTAAYGRATPAVNISGMDKLQRVQDEIGEATDVMRQNIEAVVGRGEHLEHLVDKSEGFSANARAFQKQSGHLRQAMW